jgi:hypothetical protein
MKNIYNREIKQNEKLMHVGIAGKLLIIARAQKQSQPEQLQHLLRQASSHV